MSLVFISYRRDDSAPYAGRLYDRLTARFGKGQVFMDIDQIGPGEDFVEIIDRKVGACGVAVILIGKGWLNASDADGKRRLDDPEDPVHLEVAAALKRSILVLPVLVGGATMPKMRQLPAPLAMLSRRNAVEISDSRFHTDVDKLIEALERAAKEDEPSAKSVASRGAGGSTKRLAIAAVAVVVALGAGFALTMLRGGDAGRVALPPTPEAQIIGAIGRSVDFTPMVTGGPASSAALLEVSRRAAAGSADAQYDVASAYECGVFKNLPQALHWYELAAAQGHVGAREAVAALKPPLPVEARARELESIRRDIRCVGKLQDGTTKTLDEMNEKARDAVKHIKPG